MSHFMALACNTFTGFCLGVFQLQYVLLDLVQMRCPIFNHGFENMFPVTWLAKASRLLEFRASDAQDSHLHSLTWSMTVACNQSGKSNVNRNIPCSKWCALPSDIYAHCPPWNKHTAGGCAYHLAALHVPLLDSKFLDMKNIQKYLKFLYHLATLIQPDLLPR